MKAKKAKAESKPTPTAEPKRGICYLVGAGPGDPGLVTLRAKECIELADVIVYDYLCNAELLRWAKPGAEIIYAGKKANQHTLPQAEIGQLLQAKTAEGKVVTRLKGGDPMVFGRGGEEAQDLARAGLAFEIVPGISSTIAGPAYAGIPVTHRDCNSQLTIFTGHEDPNKEEATVDYRHLARTSGTKIMLMGVERLDEITKSIMDAGGNPEEPVALIRWATTMRQQTLVGTLSDIAAKAAAQQFKAPALAVIGQVVGYRDSLNWFESRPLFGKRVVVTRTREQASELSRQLLALGADVMELPTIRIEAPEKLLEFGQLVRDCHIYDWIVFTSPNGVRAFFDMFYKIFQDAREIGRARIAAVGPGTAKKIREYRMAVDLLPEEFVAEGLVEAFKKADLGSIENLNMLWVRGNEARETLGAELSKLGAIVDEAIAYRTLPETSDVTGNAARFREEGADAITFASSSAVESFAALKLPLPANLKVVSIGPITSESIRRQGMRVDVEAETHDIPGLALAVQRALRG